MFRVLKIKSQNWNFQCINWAVFSGYDWEPEAARMAIMIFILVLALLLPGLLVILKEFNIIIL